MLIKGAFDWCVGILHLSDVLCLTMGSCLTASIWWNGLDIFKWFFNSAVLHFLLFSKSNLMHCILPLCRSIPNDGLGCFDLSFCVSLLGPSHSNHDWQHMTNVPRTVDVVDTLITLLMQNFPVAVSRMVPALFILTQTVETSFLYRCQLFFTRKRAPNGASLFWF